MRGLVRAWTSGSHSACACVAVGRPSIPVRRRLSSGLPNARRRLCAARRRHGAAAEALRQLARRARGRRVTTTRWPCSMQRAWHSGNAQRTPSQTCRALCSALQVHHSRQHRRDVDRRARVHAACAPADRRAGAAAVRHGMQRIKAFAKIGTAEPSRAEFVIDWRLAHRSKFSSKSSPLRRNGRSRRSWMVPPRC